MNELKKLSQELLQKTADVISEAYRIGSEEANNTTTGHLYGFKKGEADAVVSEVLKFVNPKNMTGLDIGSGGNPIFPQTISVDYGVGFLGPLIQVHKDARDLSLFSDSSLDYVFSSHCWEDFSNEEKPTVLIEWIRVLKSGGFLMLLLPDEQRYKEHCVKNNINPNCKHKDANFSLDSTRSIIQSNERLKMSLKEAYVIPSVGVYSFFIVFKKEN